MTENGVEQPRKKRSSVRRSKEGDDLMRRYGAALVGAEHMAEQAEERGVALVSISVRWPEDEGGNYFVVARAWTELGASVGFHDGMTLAEAVVGLLNRIKNGSMKWKEDQYAREG